MIRYILLTCCLLLTANFTYGEERSDSTIRHVLENKGIEFTDNNTVALLMNGYEKFDDMFEAIRQARNHVHLEYFNFRNDSIASALFDILKQKVKEGVKVRALFDGFGNDSNNSPLRKNTLILCVPQE